MTCESPASTIRRVLVAAACLLAVAIAASGDEAPIAGLVKSVDLATQTFVVEAPARGQARQVTIHMGPSSRVVRFVRADQGRGGFVEQPAALADLRPGSTVSVTTVHEGEREVAQVVRIVLERRP